VVAVVEARAAREKEGHRRGGGREREPLVPKKKAAMRIT
jgi:hypothetical protein